MIQHAHMGSPWSSLDLVMGHIQHRGPEPDWFAFSSIRRSARSLASSE